MVFESIVLSVVLIMFPLLAYLFYVAYSQNLDKKVNNLVLEFSLFSSFYLIIRYGPDNHILILNIPLIIMYLKGREKGAILLSVFICIYYKEVFGYSFFNVVLEYILYFFVFYIYQCYEKRRMQKDYIFILLFVLLKSFIFEVKVFIYHTYGYISTDLFIHILILMLLFLLLSCFSVYLFNLAEDIIKMHLSYAELQKDKQIRTSLFKITHEIKNPIAVCKGYLDMFDSKNPEHSEKYVPIIKEEIDRVLVLLQDFLSIHKLKIEKEILDINLLLEDVENHFTLLFRNNHIQTDFSILDDEIFILGDYHRLTQVFINIVKNSLEAIPPEKQGVIQLKTVIDGNFIRIYFSDNGEGIPSDIIDQIREPFFTTKPRGSGLGVSLSYEIIEAHGGEIEYQSVLCEGTTVIISLPLLHEHFS